MEAVDLLKNVLKQKACLVGIGNKLRGDDGFGPYLVEGLKDSGHFPEANLMIVEDVPENYVFPISRKDVANIIFIDAVYLEAPAGTVVFGPLAELEEISQIASTHKLSLHLAARVIEESGKRVYLLGVVPSSLEFGRPLSQEIKKIADELKGLIEDLNQDGRASTVKQVKGQ
jgi:hydrogenase 3 maturation protease